MNKKILHIALGIFFLVLLFAVIKNSNSFTTQIATESSVVVLKNGDVFDLTASYVTKEINGKKQKMLAYNGSIPGPTIQVEEGSEVTINFKNDTDLPALLHSHGVRMENKFDGSQSVQTEMKPEESFTYKLKFPDAGVYWYHPHVKEPYAQGLGLYGAFIVKPKNISYFPPVNREVPLFVSDIPILQNGKIDLSKTETSHSLMGHYGNVMLVNGEEDFNFKAKVGEVLRFYVINSANARPFNFAISDTKLKLVGADSGTYENASFVDSVILGPSERAIVDVFFSRAGEYKIINKTPDFSSSLGVISVAEEKVEVSYEKEYKISQYNLNTTKSIDPFRPYFYKEPDKKLKLSISMGGNMMNMEGMGHSHHSMPGGSMMSGSMTSGSLGGIEWEDSNNMMNQMSNAESVKWHLIDEATGKKDMDIEWKFKKDVPVKIRIFNDPKSMHPMQHPIHFHGQRFLVVSRDGVMQQNLVWKDTVLVKSGETVDIVLDTSNPGDWMAHCHISEHLEAGMMLSFKIE